MLKYAIHPDFVMSQNDDDVHYINSDQLIRLYQLNPEECMVIDDRKLSQREYVKLLAKAEILKLVHLAPRYSGDYLEYLIKILDTIPTKDV